MSVAAAGMSITSKQRQWSAGEEDEEEGGLALQQQATSFRASFSGIVKETKTTMENLLPTINEISSCALDINEQLNQKLDMAMDRRARLELIQKRFRQTASSVLNLTARDMAMDRRARLEQTRERFQQTSVEQKFQQTTSSLTAPLIHMSRSRAHGTTIKLPKALMTTMVEAGAEQQQACGEDLFLIRIDGMTSPAWSLYRDWACSRDADPNLGAYFAPSPEIAGCALVPDYAVAALLLREVTSIMVHYAPLQLHHFVAGPPAIPPPLLAPPAMVQVHHAKVAVTAVIEKIQQPQANYPVLSSLRPGSYICDILYHWSNADVLVAVFKP